MTNKTKRILIVEDNTEEAYLIDRAIQKEGDEYECSMVDSFGEFQEKFQEGNWDAVVSDYRFPGFTGKDVLDFVRMQDEIIPFIFVSGTIGEEFAVELMKAGASDYIIKDRLTRLPIALSKEIADATFKQKALKDLGLNQTAFAGGKAYDQSCRYHECPGRDRVGERGIRKDLRLYIGRSERQGAWCLFSKGLRQILPLWNTCAKKLKFKNLSAQK